MGSVTNLKYHVVLTTKYKKPASPFYGRAGSYVS